MAPTAIYASSVVENSPVYAAVPEKGPALVIGSLATAEDGKYQSLVSSYDESRHVEKQMLDRLLDGGITCYTLITRLF